MHINAYYDFGCPYCYALWQTLVQHGLHLEFNWYGVEIFARHDPVIAPFSDKLGPLIDAEIDDLTENYGIRGLQKPAGQVNTNLALRLADGTARCQPQAADQLKSHIYAAYWERTADISDRGTLIAIADSCGVDADAAWEEVSADAIAANRKQLKMLGGKVPYARSSSGAVLFGVHSIDKIRDFAASGAGSLTKNWSGICGI